MSRLTESWIGAFLEYTELRPSPEIFRLWAAFSTVASALQRRCYMRIRGMTVYPNLYIALIGPPGVGKSVAIGCGKEVAGAPQFGRYVCLAADSTTRESFFSQMASAANVVKRKGTKVEINIAEDDYSNLDEGDSSFNVMSAELGVLLGSRNMEFLRALADLFDIDRETFKHVTKHSGNAIIKNPWLNIIGGTTPLDLVEILPRQATNQGFTSRFIFVYSNEEYETDDIFAIHESEEELRKALLHDYGQMLEMSGMFVFDPPAANALNEWYRNRKKTEQTDTMLISYNTRRLVHVCKLTMVVAAARHQELIIKKDDVESAIAYLHDVEKNMAKALAATGGTGSEQLDVVQNTLRYIKQTYLDTGKPVRGRELRRFVGRFVAQKDIGFIMNRCKEYCQVQGDYPDEWFTPLDVEEGLV